MVGGVVYGLFCLSVLCIWLFLCLVIRFSVCFIGCSIVDGLVLCRC